MFIIFKYQTRICRLPVLPVADQPSVGYISIPTTFLACCVLFYGCDYSFSDEMSVFGLR